MKVVFPMDKKDENSLVGSSFARSLYFLIYDTNSKRSKFIKNTAHSTEGGAGIQAAQLLVDNEIDNVITFRCGVNASRVLTAAEINIYEAQRVTAKENIALFMDDKLEPLTDVTPGLHKHRD